jgi:hypothetical protein
MRYQQARNSAFHSGADDSGSVRELCRKADEAISLADHALGRKPDLGVVGKRVTIKPPYVRQPEHVGLTFETVEVRGTGNRAFAALRAPDGSVEKWFRCATELDTAPTSDQPKNGGGTLVTLSNRIAAERKIPLRDAIRLAAQENPDAARRYQERDSGRAAPSEDAGAEAKRLMLRTQELMAAADAAGRPLQLRDALKEASRIDAAALQEYRLALDVGPRSR